MKKENKKNLEQYLDKSLDKNWIKGRICEVQRGLYTVKCEHGFTHAKVKGSLKEMETPVIGDYVYIDYHVDGNSVIMQLCQRKSIFVRPDSRGHSDKYVKTLKTQILAANFDYAFIVTSLNANYNLNRITRYISTTLEGGGKPIVILTKADLCENIDSYVNEVKQISDKVEVYAASSKTGYGMEQLKPYLHKNSTIVLLGSSGVGKSTLVNTLFGIEVMKVSEIRENDAKGRHTTTHRQLIDFPDGVTVIDTPGIRELGMCDVESGIQDTFSDITDIASTCRFSNCHHETEPGCQIRAALENGTLTRERWKLYQSLQKESEVGKSKRR